MNEETFWLDTTSSNEVIKKANKLKQIIEETTTIKSKIETNIEIIELINDDKTLIEEIEKDIQSLTKNLEKLELETYLNGKYDKLNCLLILHSGAGGTEACDWTDMLYRMYNRYLTKNGYEITLLDKEYGEEVGYKSISILVKGNNAYGYLKKEQGIHRLVRISPFDSNKRRHTSFASVVVIPELDNNIDINLDEKDLKVDIYRSSGPGGQGVNTTDSAVRITHLPTKIVVTCQNERSQIKNKEIALNILKNKLKLIELEKKKEEIDELKNNTSISFGNAKRSYVMCPYTLVKDIESGYETSDVSKVLDGYLDELIEKGLRSWKKCYLKKEKDKTSKKH